MACAKGTERCHTTLVFLLSKRAGKEGIELEGFHGLMPRRYSKLQIALLLIHTEVRNKEWRDGLLVGVRSGSNKDLDTLKSSL